MSDTNENRDVREHQRVLRDSLAQDSVFGTDDYRSPHGFGKQPSSFTEFKQRGNRDFGDRSSSNVASSDK